jgi:hypothetical protein
VRTDTGGLEKAGNFGGITPTDSDRPSCESLLDAFDAPSEIEGAFE